MKLRHYVWAAFALATLPVMAEEKDGYKFNTVVQQKTTPVKDQAISGTCWCFATTSFIESELLRQGKGEYAKAKENMISQKCSSCARNT